MFPLKGVSAVRDLLQGLDVQCFFFINLLSLEPNHPGFTQPNQFDDVHNSIDPLKLMEIVYNFPAEAPSWLAVVVHVQSFIDQDATMNHYQLLLPPTVTVVITAALLTSTITNYESIFTATSFGTIVGHNPMVIRKLSHRGEFSQATA